MAFCLAMVSCEKKESSTSTAPSVKGVEAKNFEATVDGKEVKLYVLKNGSITMQVTNYGARVVSLFTPDRNGNEGDVVLGFDTLEKYQQDYARYYGSAIGRYANRIGAARFSLDGKTYDLDKNDNKVNMLHGGFSSYDCKVWTVEKVTENSIDFSYVSPDGENGFPGTVTIKMTYTLTPENELKIVYAATTDKPTVINLTHHSFFNLHGEGKGSINDHELTIKAKEITPVDDLLIPDGTLRPVVGTPFDFTQAKSIESALAQEDEQMKKGNGLDHNWVITKDNPEGVEWVASIYDPVSGRLMDVLTDQVGIQFYGGNFFDGKPVGKNGEPHRFREGFAMETQKFPDSPNHDNFPSTRLDPGETYTQTCIYKFSVRP